MKRQIIARAKTKYGGPKSKTHEIALTDHLEFVLMNHRRVPIKTAEVTSILSNKPCRCFDVLRTIREAFADHKLRPWKRLKIPKAFEKIYSSYQLKWYRYRGSITSGVKFIKTCPETISFIHDPNNIKSRCDNVFLRFLKRKNIPVTILDYRALRYIVTDYGIDLDSKPDIIMSLYWSVRYNAYKILLDPERRQTYLTAHPIFIHPLENGEVIADEARYWSINLGSDPVRLTLEQYLEKAKLWRKQSQNTS